MGLASPFRIAMMPAMVVVLTRAETDEQNADFAAGRSNGEAVRHGRELYHSSFGGFPLPRSADGSLNPRWLIWTPIRPTLEGPVKLFRPAASPHQTALAMIGAKPGSTVIVVGASEPALAAEVALVTGLNGRTLVVVPDRANQPAIDAAAANAGALIDVETAPATALPGADGTFDIAVLLDLGHAADRDRIIREAARVVRPSGRIVVIDGRKASGIRKLLGGGGPAGAGSEDIVARLATAGLRGARLLGSAEGISYFEGTRPASPQGP